MKPFFKKLLKQRGYVIEARLGLGGEAKVYQAFQTGHGKCAIKVHDHELDDPTHLPRHFREGIDVAVEFRGSPYFVTLYAWFVEEYRLFTVWELANGTLKDRLETRLANGQGPFSRRECCHYLQNVAMGLDELHARSGVHGDIKPENLLIFGKAVVKIGDLGISRLMTSLTTRHTDMRSKLYSLPIIHLGPPTRKRDLFSFAATYVELRLGRHAYGTTSEICLRNLINNQPQFDGLDDDEVALIKPLLLQDDNAQSLKDVQLVEWLEEIWQSKPIQSPPTSKSKLETCAYCHGTGLLRLPDNGGIIPGSTCPHCHGELSAVFNQLLESIHNSDVQEESTPTNPAA